MRAYTIALFLLMIQVAAAVVDTTNVFETSINPDTDAINWSEQYVGTTSYNATIGGASQPSDYEIGGITSFFEFGIRVINVKATMVQMGIEDTMLLWLFASPIYFIWLNAIIQFLWRKGYKDMV